ncbi:hypothetical protein F4802DRAFT_601363 [Xylaria palmicola]|nr:hypothetical protein F4802DRAFT_601363 [Xylaria palmicola]
MFRAIAEMFLCQWHRILNLPTQSPPSWYSDRYHEELEELEDAKSRLEKISEESDVFFTLSRAKYDGYPVADLPAFEARHVPIYGYMLAKYTSRCAFYHVLALLCGAPSCSTVREVVNPTKDEKLEVVARRHLIDPEKFKTTANGDGLPSLRWSSVFVGVRTAPVHVPIRT